MTLRANFQKSYSRRYLLLAGGFTFAALFFAYDGLIGYPHKKLVAERYAEIEEMEASERQKAWRQITEDNNWSRAVPGKTPEQIADDIRGQYFYGIIAMLIALPPAILYFRTRGSWIESTPQGLTTSWGQSLDFSKVIKLDKKRWVNKGIAVATYQDGSNVSRFVFDDFKYDREPLGQMLRELEQVLTPDRIVGGPPEKLANKTADETPEKADIEPTSHTAETPQRGEA
jgi:hypothetical protein